GGGRSVGTEPPPAQIPDPPPLDGARVPHQLAPHTDPGPSGGKGACRDVGPSPALLRRRAHRHLAATTEAAPSVAAPLPGRPLWAWLAFATVVAALLVFDLGVLHRREREIPVGESLLLAAGYIAVALMFGGLVWWQLGPQSGIDYFTGYLIEKTL